ncbi:uncharacterized protein LOC110739381 [Chenopodium quinoa]|uniref:uncharacterized protein LOC110739381 n=1 Tax=Chenopodium quinoa TaxID=63459 RepID=UPI000B78F314|nr:uncharacterized protein LOC110739381 [Chenopodium quinoa]
MRNRLEDILGVDLAEAMRDVEEGGHGCKRELRFNSENGVSVGLDFEDYEEECDGGVEVEGELISSDEDGERECEYLDEDESEGDGEGVENDDLEEVEEVVGDVGASGSGFTTPKRNRGMLRLFLGRRRRKYHPLRWAWYLVVGKK